MGAGGVAIALPFLEIFAPRSARAEDQGSKVPDKLVTFVLGQGTLTDEMIVPGASATDFELGAVLAPLNPVKDKLAVFTNVRDRAAMLDSFNAHTRCAISTLTVAGSQGDVARGPSIDQVIAAQIGAHTTYKSLEVGVNSKYKFFWTPEGAPKVVENSPQNVFDLLFAGLATKSPEQLEALRAQRKSVLDVVMAQHASLERRLGSADKVRMERHLTSIRELERRVQPGTTLPACLKPEEPGKPNDYGHQSRLHVDLLVQALACDLTRVISLSYDDPRDWSFHNGLSFADGWHNAVHAGPSTPDRRAALRASFSWYSQEFLHLLERLQEVEDSQGDPLLDSTLVLQADTFGSGSEHSASNKTFMLAGNTATGLRGGRHIDANERSPSDVYTTLLEAMGLGEMETFGVEEYNSGTFSEVLR